MMCCVLYCSSCSVYNNYVFSRIDPDTSKPVKIYPLPHMYVMKDLIPDMTHFFDQYASVQPWLQVSSWGVSGLPAYIYYIHCVACIQYHWFLRYTRLFSLHSKMLKQFKHFVNFNASLMME